MDQVALPSYVLTSGHSPIRSSVHSLTFWLSDRGVQRPGYCDPKSDKFHFVKEMVPELVVPDISDFDVSLQSLPLSLSFGFDFKRTKVETNKLLTSSSHTSPTTWQRSLGPSYKPETSTNERSRTWTRRSTCGVSSPTRPPSNQRPKPSRVVSGPGQCPHQTFSFISFSLDFKRKQ